MNRAGPPAPLPNPIIRNGRLIITDIHGRTWRDLGPAKEAP